MRITGGNGKGYEAFVDDEGRLQVFAVVESEDKHTNKHRGNVWSLPFTATPVGAGDYFFYFKNTGTVNYYITDILIDAAAADVIGLHWVTGTPTFTAGTDLSGYSRNAATTSEPVATMKSDTDTTGLTDGGELYFLTCEANKLAHLQSSSNIIVTPGSAIALKTATGTAAIKGMVSVVGTD